MAYYPDWVADDYPPEKVDFGRFDWIDYAFAVPDDDRALSWDGADDAADVLHRLVDRAHAHGKRVKLSVGGWSGSKYFSSAVADAQGRTALADSMLALYNQHGLDGIDIDWEYPSQAGAAGNEVRPDDSAHFLEFLRTLRATLPPNATITAATQTVPFADADGRPMQDVSGFARVLDWVLVMNYDTWGSSSKPGPNAPLSNACKNSTQSRSNALSALQLWTSAGFAPSQLVLGVPSYGYISRSSELSLQTRSPRSRARARLRDGQRPGRRRRRRALLDVAAEGILPGVVRVKNEDGGTDDGQVQFRELVRQGIVQANTGSDVNVASLPLGNGAGRRLFAGAGGFVRMWDACSSTPYLRSADARQVVTYDDPASLEMKAELVRGAGMRGVNMFDVHGDTDAWDLTDALRRGLGLLYVY
ncbi:glycoside hydrolase [Daedaleopsis nitida]|nr:glycoside hydrolase [Daedaleopsis nitida]